MTDVRGLDEEQQITLAALSLFLMNRDIAGSTPTDAAKKEPIRDAYRKLLSEGPLGSGAPAGSQLPSEQAEVLWQRVAGISDVYAMCLMLVELEGTNPWNPVSDDAEDEKKKKKKKKKKTIDVGRFWRRLEIDAEIRRLTLREFVQNSSSQLRASIVDWTEHYLEDGGRAVLGSKRWAGPLVGGGVGAILGGLVLAPHIGAAIGGTAGLSGAAATSAGLAMLGGGALAAGGFGMAGGTIVVSTVVSLTGAGVGTATDRARSLGARQSSEIAMLTRRFGCLAQTVDNTMRKRSSGA